MEKQQIPFPVKRLYPIYKMAPFYPVMPDPDPASSVARVCKPSGFRVKLGMTEHVET